MSISDDEIKAISSNIAFQLEQMLNFLTRSEKNTSQIYGKVFKNRLSKICGRQPLKKLKGYGLPKADLTHSKLLKAVIHKI